MSNMYGRQTVLPLVNKSGGVVIAGDVVIIDTANDGAFTTTTVAQSQKSVGVAQETIASNATGRILVSGYAALVNVQASVTRGHYLETYSVAKQGNGNSTRRAGTFGQFLTGGTTPTAWLWGFPDNAGAAGSTVATDTIWDAAGDLAQGTGADTAAKLSAGTAGYFLMAGGAATALSWAKRELDYVETTSTVSVTANTEGTANTVLTGTSQAYTATPIIVHFFCPRAATQATAGAGIVVLLYDGASVLGRLALLTAETNAAQVSPISASYRFTPSAATHQYIIKAFTTAGTASLIGAGGGSSTELPTYMRIERAT